MKVHCISRHTLRASTALALAAWLPATAYAQEADSAGGLEEIVVTAQKREQSLQDVPIAVTAVTQETLQANRIYTVNDLSAIAPGLTVKPSAGGIQTPSFTMRGQVSFGVVAGSDKQVSIYLDGVYISSPRGSIFEMPDIQRLEVLRGPQGTLFGRNATAGAVSITTRDPTGDAHARIEGTIGNYDAYRIRTTLETPQFGPLSGYFSYVRNYRRGEIENSQAGLLWDRTASPSGYGKAASPRWLGTVDSNSYFAAVKLEPSDDFKMVYKYDRNDDSGTPEGTAIAAYDKSVPLFSNVLTALYASNGVHFNPSAKRPDIVDNGWVVPRQQQVQGHSLTATWQGSDSITVKNVAAYRKANVFSPSAIDGVSTLTLTQQTVAPLAALSAFSVIGTPTGTALGITSPATAVSVGIPFFAQNVYGPHVGQRVAMIASQAGSIAKQYSDELVVNYSSEKLQATLGAIWFHSDDELGGPIGEQNTFLPFVQSGIYIPTSGVVPVGNEGRSFNKATSLAAYIQLEYKITPELEVVGGARITHDEKESSFRYDIKSATSNVPTTIITPPDYKKTKPNFLVGLNWKPSEDMLVYGKWSSSFVSGGSTAGIVYEPETASSFEVGVKADFLDRRLRTNLAVFHVDYNHYQSPQGTSAPQSFAIAQTIFTQLYGPTIGAQLPTVVSTFVIDQGKVRAQGFELEVTAAPTRGLTLGGSVSYTDVKYPYINPVVLDGNGLTGNPGGFRVTARPKWTASVYGVYETDPLFHDATLQFRADGQYRSSINFSINPAKDLFADGSNAASVLGTEGFMLVNGRIALRHLKIGPGEAELALWGKNLTNRKDATFALALGAPASSNNFVAPRTYGIDLNVDF